FLGGFFGLSRLGIRLRRAGPRGLPGDALRFLHRDRAQVEQARILLLEDRHADLVLDFLRLVVDAEAALARFLDLLLVGDGIAHAAILTRIAQARRHGDGAPLGIVDAPRFALLLAPVALAARDRKS